MAVLHAHPGLAAQIIVKKVPLVEYDDDEADLSPMELTKYVEAQSGAEFAIQTTFRKPFPKLHGVEIRATIDGNRGPCWAVKADDDLYRLAQKMSGVDFTQDGKRYHQNYKFADLNIVEDLDGPVDLKSLRKEVELKGCIEVQYRWVTNFATRVRPEKPSNTHEASAPKDEPTPAPMPRRQLPTIAAIPEKALKGDARSHQAILGDPKVKKAAKGPGCTYDYVDREPFGIVRFKYRSLAALKALRIIVEEEDTQTEAVAESSPDAEHQTANMAHERTTRSSKGGKAKWKSVKQEPDARSCIKREQGERDDSQEESDKLAVVEERSCKRPRMGQEVIVLD